MEPQLILTSLNKTTHAQVFYKNPTHIPENFAKFLNVIINIDIIDNYFQITQDEYLISNLIFSIHDPWNEDKKRHLMLSVILQAQQKAVACKSFLKYLETIIVDQRNLFKAFHASDKLENKEVQNKLLDLKGLMDDAYLKLLSLEENTSYGNILILGLQNVGKTSLIKRLNEGSFQFQIRPTLGTQILHTIIENLKFNIYDVGGQQKFRKYWFTTIKEPDAIIFVVDLGENDDYLEQSREIFDQVISHFYTNIRTDNKKQNIPLLILGNKLDLIAPKERGLQYTKIQSLLNPERFNIEFNIGLVSALTNEGITSNFKWLIAETFLSQLYISKYQQISPVSDKKLILELEKIQNSSSTKTFSDYIDYLWIFNTDGIELFSHLKNNKINQVFLQNFFSVMRSISVDQEEITRRVNRIGRNRYYYFRDQSKEVYIVARASVNHSDEKIFKMISSLYQGFIENYDDILSDFDGNVKIFQEFGQKINSLI